MQNSEPVPIEIFAQQVLGIKAATSITDNWPIKPEVVMQVVVKHLQDLGYYTVSPFGQYDIVKEEVLHFLNNSVQIIDLIEKAKKTAAAAAQRGKVQRDM